MNDRQARRLDEICMRLTDLAIELENTGLKYGASLVHELQFKLSQMDGVEIIDGNHPHAKR